MMNVYKNTVEYLTFNGENNDNKWCLPPISWLCIKGSQITSQIINLHAAKLNVEKKSNG